MLSVSPVIFRDGCCFCMSTRAWPVLLPQGPWTERAKFEAMVKTMDDPAMVAEYIYHGGPPQMPSSQLQRRNK